MAISTRNISLLYRPLFLHQRITVFRSHSGQSYIDKKKEGAKKNNRKNLGHSLIKTCSFFTCRYGYSATGLISHISSFSCQHNYNTSVSRQFTNLQHSYIRVPTRNFALRARGLSSSSSLEGPIPFPLTFKIAS